MNFDLRFPQDGGLEQVMVYLRELRGVLNGFDKEVLRIVRAEMSNAIALHEKEFHNSQEVY